MGLQKPTIDDLRAQLDDFRFGFPALSDDQLFVLWFLRAYLADDDDLAARAITGGAGDKGIDACSSMIKAGASSSFRASSANGLTERPSREATLFPSRS